MKKLFITLVFVFSYFTLVGQTNMGMQFSGGKNYINVPHFAVPEALTIEAWIQTTQTSVGSIVTWKNAETNGEAVIFRVAGGKLVYGEWIRGKWNEYKTNVSVNSGSWVHVAVVRGESSIRLYVNGVEAYENTNTAFENSISKTTALSIGAIQTNVSGDVINGESYVGLIDEVRMWNKMLTATDINAQMKSSISPEASGLIAYFNFDGSCNDLSVNAHHASVRGVVPYVESDIFSAAAISALSWEESKGKMPVIKMRANVSGMLYWCVKKKGLTAPTVDELMLGADMEIKGVEEYVAANGEQQFSVNNSLIQTGEYVLYALLKQGVQLTEVESHEFTYIALQQLPLGWFNTDVGTVGKTGTTYFEESLYTVNGSGGDIWGNKDAFQYVCTTRNGDTELIARIDAQQNTDSWAKSGIMIRSSLEENSAFVMIGVAQSAGVHFSYRNQDGWNAKMQFTNKNINTPLWLRLVYKDGYALAYFSTDGENWDRIKYPVRLATPNEYYAGMVSCSHNNNALCASAFSNVTVSQPEASMVINEKGMYFDKKSYTDDGIPVFATDKDKLPIPVLDNNEDWITLYWRAWELAFQHMARPVEGSNYVSNFYDEAFNDDIFQWDIIFMTLFGKYANHLFPAAQSFDNFYANQHRDGLIVRQLSPKGDDTIMGDSVLIFPPLFSWAEMENYRFTGDKLRLQRILPVLEKYYEYIEGYHRGWDTKHQLYWTHGYASGMDNTPRDNGRPNGHSSFDHQGWVDLSAQMVIQCNNIAEMCKELSLPEKELLYKKRAAEIAQRMNSYMWNEADGLYYDVDVESVQTNHKTAACFWPMLADITSKEQNEKLVANLKNPATFWRDMVFPTLAADQPEYKSNGGYWLGGVWAPTNYAIIKGLSKQGYYSFAKEASERYIAGLYEVLQSTNTIWENYAPERIDGKIRQGVSGGNTENFCRYDFVGWSGLGPISLLIEEVIGIKADGVSRFVEWDLNRLDRNGIKNLRFGEVTADLICNKRDALTDKAILSVKTNEPFELLVRVADKEYQFDVQLGENQFVCDAEATSAIAPPKESFTSFVVDNPVVNQLRIYSKKSCTYRFEMYDLLGNECLAGSSSSTLDHFSVVHLRSGCYLLTINDGERSVVKKIVIEK